MGRRHTSSRIARQYRPWALGSCGLSPGPEALESRLLLTAVLTYHDDTSSTGQNPPETILYSR